jgi:ABC-2 type transport system permease protein
VVATLLKLRFRVLGNQLMASPWQLVGFIFGMMWAAGLLLLVWAGLVAAGFAGLEVVRTAVTAGGAVLLLGWMLGPVLVAGVDTTLDPDRLAPFPISTDRMMVALAAAGLTGVPGIATVAGALAVIPAFLHWPIAAAVAVVCVPLGVITCVVASRLIASLMSGASGNRRVREIIGGLAFLLLILIGPIFAGISGLVRTSVSAGPDPFAPLGAALSAVSWTPLAAAWAVPGDIAAGDWLPALVKFLVAVATPVLLWWLWRRILVSSQGAPVQRSTRQVKPGKLGWVGRMPTGGTGASWARSLTYWMHDPRYLRQLLVVPVFPVLMLVYSGGDVRSTLFAFSAVVIAFVFAVVPYVDVSYDGTAFASVLATGVRGRSDRAGRMLGASVIAVPLIAVVAVITVALSGKWDLLVPVLGASIGMLLTGFGVCAVSSALVVVPVAAPGDSPFKRVPGTSALMGFLMLGVWLIIALLGSPAAVLAIIAAVTGSPGVGWAALIVGLVLGAVFLAIGILVGGRIFDRTAPELLARLRSMQNA